MSRNLFNHIKFVRVPSNLTSNVSGDGAFTTSPGNLCQDFTTLVVNNFFFRSSLNLPSFSLNSLPFAMSQRAQIKSLSPSFLQAPFKYWKPAVRSPHSLHFSRLNSPNSLSLSSECSSPQITFLWLFSGPVPKGPCLCYKSWRTTSKRGN